MRVLHLTPEFPPVIWGGLGTAVGGLVTASAQAGIETGVLLVGGALVLGNQPYAGGWQPLSLAQVEQATGKPSVVNADGVIFFHVAPDDAVVAALQLVRHWRPDVIHLHTAWLWHVARAIQEQTQIPIVFTVHSLDRAEYEIGQFVNQWNVQDEVIARADRIIAISESEKQLLRQFCPQVMPKVRVVGNGINDSASATNAALTRCYHKAEPLVLYTGRFVDRKGIHELLTAIPLVLAQAANTRFVLVGGYGGGAEIERTWLQAELLPYRHQVHFTGWLPPAQVAQWYQAADVLVVPSWYEPFGMVILEGMLYGLPIAAANVGGPAEILQHAQTGLLFPPKDAGALADTILQLVQNANLRQQIGHAAGQAVRRTWLWAQTVGQMRTVYQELSCTQVEKARLRCNHSVARSVREPSRTNRRSRRWPALFQPANR